MRGGRPHVGATEWNGWKQEIDVIQGMMAYFNAIYW